MVIQTQTKIDKAVYLRNFPIHFPPEVLARYAGQSLAISGDGTTVVATGPDLAAVLSKVQAAGIDPGEVVFDFVPAADEDGWL